MWETCLAHTGNLKCLKLSLLSPFPQSDPRSLFSTFIFIVSLPSGKQTRSHSFSFLSSFISEDNFPIMTWYFYISIFFPQINPLIFFSVANVLFRNLINSWISHSDLTDFSPTSLFFILSESYFPSSNVCGGCVYVWGVCVCVCECMCVCTYVYK